MADLTKTLRASWMKGFNISGVEGRDVVAELEKVLRQEDVKYSWLPKCTQCFY